jgi:hypothetical protein
MSHNFIMSVMPVYMSGYILINQNVQLHWGITPLYIKTKARLKYIKWTRNWKKCQNFKG